VVEDTKVKDRQYNDKKLKMPKRTNDNPQNTTQKTNDWATGNRSDLICCGRV